MTVFFVFAAYFSMILGIGFWASSHTKTDCDFNLGGREMNFWTTALSAHASDMSAWLFMSLPMLVFTQGASNIWLALGLFIGMWINWAFVAKKLREKTAEADCITLPAWFAHHFKDQKGRLGLLCALFSLMFLVHYLGAGLIAMGLLFERLFEIDYDLAILISMILIAAYTMKGGYEAVAWVDLFQGVFLLVVILIVPCLIYSHLESLSEVQSHANNRGVNLDFLKINSWKQGLEYFFNAAGWGIGYLGMPHVLSKFMGIKSSSEMKKSQYVGMTWHFLALLGSVFIGFMGIGFFKEPLVNNEMLFVEMVRFLFSPAGSTLVLCAILAANISTMDSQLLVCASSLADDLFAKIKGLSSRFSNVSLTRISIALLSLIAWVVASSKDRSIQGAVLYSWSGLGVTFAPLVLSSLYWPQLSNKSAYASLLLGCSTVMLWPHYQVEVVTFFKLEGLEVPPLVPGFTLSIISMWGVYMMEQLGRKKRA